MSEPIRDIVVSPIEDSFEFWSFATSETETTAVRGAGGYVSGTISISGKALRMTSPKLALTWQVEIGRKPSLEQQLQAGLKQSEHGLRQTLNGLALDGNLRLVDLLEAMAKPLQSEFVDSLSRFAKGDLKRLAIRSDVDLPWRAMYLDPSDPLRRIDPDEEIDSSNFLGAAGAIDVMPLTSHGRRPDGAEVPIGMHRSLIDGPSGRLALTELFAPRIDLTTLITDDERELLKAICHGAPALIYLVVHGESHDTPQGAFHTLNTFNKPWSADDLKKYLGKSKEFNTAPLVLVNACHAGADFGGESVVSGFLKHGANATLAPIVAIPTVFAEWFGLEVIKLLLDGHSLNESVLSATRIGLSRYNNPLGLAYTVINGLSSVPMPSALP